MPPLAKFTKEEIVNTAFGIARESGMESVTAREIGRRLGTSTRPLFTYFKTVDEVRCAVVLLAYAKYNEYVDAGLAMNPPFKGFGMQYVRFAQEEPHLFRLLFMRENEGRSYDEFIVGEGHSKQFAETIMGTFDVSRGEARKLLRNIWFFAHGIATMCVTKVCRFSDREVSSLLGTACRGMLMELKAPADSRTDIEPRVGKRIKGDVRSYVG